MRILIAHASYRVPGGEDRYVQQQLDLLGGSHDVELLAARNEDLRSNASTAARMVVSRSAVTDVETAVRRFRPDVIHVHNVYPGFGPAVHLAASRTRVPLVMTVHNYRLRCPNGLQFTEGAVCRRCERGVYAHAVLHECFPSGAQAGAYAASLWIHRFVLRLEGHVALFIAPSLFIREQLERWGIAPERVRVIRHSVDVSSLAASAVGESGTYIGRLSQEKGVETLLRALRAAGDPPFVLVGDGPERAKLERVAGDLGLRRERFAGHVSPDEVHRILQDARFVTIPSLCHEVAPLAAMEAMAAGRPLLATRVGGLPELVGDDRGELCEPGDVDGMADAIRSLMADDDRCRRAGRAASAYAREMLTPARHRAELEDAYELVVGSQEPAVRRDRAS